jgi:hypothetical protein
VGVVVVQIMAVVVAQVGSVPVPGCQLLLEPLTQLPLVRVERGLLMLNLIRVLILCLVIPHQQLLLLAVAGVDLKV